MAGAERRALVVGVNNFRRVTKLRGCAADVHHVAFTLKALGYRVRYLIDAAAHRQAVLDGLAWLRELKRDDDRWVFWHSWHGSQVQDADGDEQDSLDEVLCPYDGDYPSERAWWEGGLIWDDEIPDMLPLCPGIYGGDLCHSGTMYRAVNPHDVVSRSIQPPADLRDVNRPVRDRTVSSVTSHLEASGRSYLYLGASQDEQVAADYQDPDCPVCKQRPRWLLEKGLAVGYHGALTRAWLDSVWAATGMAWKGDRFEANIPHPWLHGDRLVGEIGQWFSDRRHDFDQRPSMRAIGAYNMSEPIFGEPPLGA